MERLVLDLHPEPVQKHRGAFFCAVQTSNFAAVHFSGAVHPARGVVFHEYTIFRFAS